MKLWKLLPILLISYNAHAAHFLRQLVGDVTDTNYTAGISTQAMCDASIPSCLSIGGTGGAVSLPFYSYVDGITNHTSVPSEYPSSFVGTSGWFFEGGRDGSYLYDSFTYNPAGITGTIINVTAWAYAKISGSDGNNDNTMGFSFCAGPSGSEVFVDSPSYICSTAATTFPDWFENMGNVGQPFPGLVGNGDMSPQWLSAQITGLSINAGTELNRPIVRLQQGMDCGLSNCSGAPSPLYEIYSFWIDIETSSPSYSPNYWPMFF